MLMTDNEFALVKNLIYERFGIYLPEQKRSLLTNRLSKLLSDSGYKSWRDYYDSLVSDQSGDDLNEFVNRITTNHTYFYREEKHFQFFASRVLPEIADMVQKEGHRDLRIWCAGCSSGEEAYTLAMLMMDYFGSNYPLWDAGLLATDISGKALEMAQNGVYSTERISTLPPALKHKYFVHRGADEWVVDKKLREQITFRRFNLMANFPFKKPFHAIFCRNVMIYFDQKTREELVNKFFAHTAVGGYLFIGHSESLGRVGCPYKYVLPAVYRKM
jgi:chemotaxis protein methyltransferase CheR